jgi:hypothetical protein
MQPTTCRIGRSPTTLLLTILLTLPLVLQMPPVRAQDPTSVYQIGPIDTPARLREAERRVRNLGHDFTTRQEGDWQSLGFIVVTPLLASPLDVSNQLGRLHDSGLDDVTLMRSGTYARRVSVGVYGAQANARRRADLVRS